MLELLLWTIFMYTDSITMHTLLCSSFAIGQYTVCHLVLQFH